MVDGGEVRQAIRARILDGDVTGPADLARRLQTDGLEVAPDELRGHLRAVGALRVAGSDGPVLALPADRGREREPGSGPARGGRPSGGADAGADPDRALQLTVALVVVAFLVLGLAGWLLA